MKPIPEGARWRTTLHLTTGPGAQLHEDCPQIPGLTRSTWTPRQRGIWGESTTTYGAHGAVHQSLAGAVEDLGYDPATIPKRRTAAFAQPAINEGG